MRVDIQKEHDPMTSPNEQLKAVASVLREKGWCQGSTQNETGQRCLYGAMISSGIKADGMDLIYERLKRRYGTDAIGLWLWNDDPDRTVEQVLDLLENEG